MFLSMSPFLQFHIPKLYPLPLCPFVILNSLLLVSPQVDHEALGGPVVPVGGGLDDRGAVEPKDEARRGEVVRLNDTQGGGLVDRGNGGDVAL